MQVALVGNIVVFFLLNVDIWNMTLLWLLMTKIPCIISWELPHAIRNSSQPNIPQTSKSGTHTHRQHTATYQINNLTTQTNREVVTALSTKDGPLKMVKQ